MDQPRQPLFGPLLSRLHGRLYGIAGRLQAATDLPVETEHVILALMLASLRDGYPPAEGEIDWDDPAIYDAALRHIRAASEMARKRTPSGEPGGEGGPTVG
jgi:hypothetical protein